MHLHQRGIDLLVNVQDAADHVDNLTGEDVRRLLAEISIVLSELLERDIPTSGLVQGPRTNKSF